MLDLVAPVAIYEDIWTPFYEYGGALQATCLTVALFSYFSVETGRAKAVLLFTTFYSLYAQIEDIIFSGIHPEIYIIQTLAFLAALTLFVCRDYEED